MSTKSSNPATGTDTITIWCKHAPGIMLRAGEWIERSEGSVSGAVRTVREWRATASFTVAGPARRFGEDHTRLVVGGYAVTHGCPRDLWEAWLADNKDSALVRNNIIFASPKTDDAGKAREYASVRTGLEPLLVRRNSEDPGDPRVPGSERIEARTEAA